MSAATETVRAAPDEGGSLAAVTAKLAGRSLMLIPRVPSTFIPSLVFPIFLVVAFSGAFSALVKLPGFPVPKMIDWVLPMAIVQGAAFAGITTGLGVARDLEGGFFDRLRLAPVRPTALVTGPLLAAAGRSLPPYLIVLVVGLLSGARMPGGIPGALVLLVASVGIAIVAGGWAVGLALRIKSMQAAPLMQVGVFLLIFLSTAQVPLSVMTGWLHTVARFNPMTYVLALGRQGFIGGLTWHESWPGLLALGAGCVLFTLFAVRGLRSFTD
ncbi:MAG: type transport system permease protein [Actinomycetota bacterium]|nr:type transport system permease protein [Actinomycetota bacterium]